MHILFRRTLCLYLVIFPVLAKQSLSETNQNTVLISHVNIIDVANDQVITNQFVLIKDNIIEQISSVKPNIHLGSKLIDGKDKYLMAGLIDMHVHIFQPADLYQLLRHGVTTARVMYGWPQTLAYRDDIILGKLAGPDLVVASPIINQESPYVNSNIHRFVDTPKQASRLVKKYVKQGYDLIKTYDGLRPEVFSAIAKTAKENDLPIAGHPSFYLSIDDYLEVKPQTIEHIEMLYQASLDYSRDPNLLEKLVKKLATHQIPVTTTLVVYDNLARMAVEKHQFIDSLPLNYIHPLLKKLEEDSLDFMTKVNKPHEWRSKADYLGHMAKVLNKHGVPLVIGSDGGVGYTINGKSTLDEMELLAHYGVATNEILRAATITPAKALNKETSIGIVAPGYLANLILLTSDPRDDLSILRTPLLVIKSGRLFEQRALTKLDKQAQKHMSLIDTAIHLFRAL
jgi:imidazolonepropionase-like amidohydrolase